MEERPFTIKELEPELITDMYLTFLDSFSDYEIPFRLTRDEFAKKFVHKLRLDFKLSAGAFNHGNGLVGFVYTTVNNYNGLKTAYNGGTGVRPGFRGHRLVTNMYDYLLPKFEHSGVQQCVLEVLVGNVKAIKAYENIGFKKSDYYRCYKLEAHFKPTSLPDGYHLLEVSAPHWERYKNLGQAKTSFLDSAPMIDLNLDNETVIEARFGLECVGYAIYQPIPGRISQLAVDPAHRRRGVGKALIYHIFRSSRNKALTIMNVANEYQDMIRFFERIGFRNQLDQYEMMLEI